MQQQGKRVAVVGCEAPGRTALLAALLHSCVGRHGWSERLSVRAFGMLAGSGAPRTQEIEAARRAGFSLEAFACAPLEQDDAFLDTCSVIVALTDADADLLLQTPQAEGKPVLCVADLLDEEAARVLRESEDPGEVLAALEPDMPELLRKLIAA